MANGYRLGIWKDEDNHTVIKYEDLAHGEDKMIEIFPDGRAFKVIWAHEIDAPEDDMTRILKPVDLAQALIELATWLEENRFQTARHKPCQFLITSFI